MSDSPTTPPHLLIRADASSEIGTGHVMRMIALAQAYQDRGGTVTVASVMCPDGLIQRIRRAGILFQRIGDGIPGGAPEAQKTIRLAKLLSSAWAVLDGYHFDLSYQRVFGEEGVRIMVVDDYGRCEAWIADAILNQNLFAPELGYRSEVPGSRLLLGTRFALLRREFRENANRSAEGRRAEDACIQRLLVTLGGHDRENVTGRLLDALNTISEPKLEIKVVVGVDNLYLDSLDHLASGSPHAVQLHRNVVDMPSLYHWCDGVISAGGSTCWEWMFYELPAAVVCVADNQRPVIASLVKHRLAVDLGWHADLDPTSTSEKLRDWLLRPHDFVAGSPLPELTVDGFGAERVAAVLDGSHAWLRRAQGADVQQWFKWANDPTVRANGFHPQPISWDAHVAWFEGHRKSADSRLWLGFDLEGAPLGYVRLHRRQVNEWEVGVAVAPERRGQGIGATLVRLALARFAREPGAASALILARIKPSNVASLSLFRSLEFRQDALRPTAEGCILTRKIE